MDGKRLNLCCSQSLSDETRNFIRDWYRDIFLRPNVFETDTKTFFETKYFRDRYWDFFSRLNIFETDTETFFRDQNFRDRDRYSQKIEKSLDTEKSRDEMSHSFQLEMDPKFALGGPKPISRTKKGGYPPDGQNLQVNIWPSHQHSKKVIIPWLSWKITFWPRDSLWEGSSMEPNHVVLCQ